MTKLSFGTFLNVGLLVFFALLFSGAFPSFSDAKNIHTYSDTITDSAPSAYSNHAFEFTVLTDIAAGGYLEFTLPADFTLLDATTTFSAKNVELYDDGVARTASETLGATTDQVIITGGAGGVIRYNLNPTTGISADSVLRLLVGTNTTGYEPGYTAYSTSTGTTTVPADEIPIRNSATVGTHIIEMVIGGGTQAANAGFNIAVIDTISIADVDTTEVVPPYRFNPAPTSTVGGTTLNVEISLETDELAVCKWSASSSVAYTSMTNTFDTTGTVVHSTVVSVTAGALNIFYVRCIDDEGNFNTDDFLIAFSVNDSPTGTPNSSGGTEGDGTGSGDDGTGTGSQAGGVSGSGGTGANTSGGTSGSGGSGGGSGGSSGPDSSGNTGGGLESGNNPYRSGDAEVIIKGYAFPGSTVYALVDGTISESVRASNQGSYELTLDNIARGVYTFGVYAVGSDLVKSTTFSTSFTVTGGRTSELSNINIMPSILITPDPVDVGQTVTLSGYAIANADITIEHRNDKTSASLKTYTTTSDGNGKWSLDVNTSSFSAGTYKVRAKAVQSAGLGISTAFSEYTYYGVGQNADVPLNADLNTDGSVNLTDFSILLYWWGGDGGDSSPPADINRDGSVSLTDFSIMLFQWTG